MNNSPLGDYRSYAGEWNCTV